MNQVPERVEASVGQLLLGRGEMGRLRYALWGLGLTLVKWNLDRLLGASLLGVSERLDYRALAQLYLWQSFPAGVEREGMLWMLAASLPFLFAGVMFTLGRLRSAGMAAGWVLLFFVPAVKILFFVLLSGMPRRVRSQEPAKESGWVRWIPHSAWGAACAAVVLTTVFALLTTAFAVKVADMYGWALFVGTPFALGFVSTLLFTAREPRPLMACLWVTGGAMLLAGGGLLLFAMEGVVCLVMAAPLALVIGMVGTAAAWGIRQSWPGNSWSVLPAGLMAIALPGTMGVEGWMEPVSPLRPVRTEVVVAAPPEVVWKHVVSFSELPPPDEFLFRIGLAYPVRAEMLGSGVGAVRRCHFSTGPFVEPITVWDEPNRLAFRVESNPPPMQEWTPYEDIHPPHLDGHFVSRQGEFLLERTASGGTRLVGTTWYEHRLWPDAYWRLWSDAIIHRIHLRVLRHVQALSEAEISGAAGPAKR